MKIEATTASTIKTTNGPVAGPKDKDEKGVSFFSGKKKKKIYPKGKRAQKNGRK